MSDLARTPDILTIAALGRPYIGHEGVKSWDGYERGYDDIINSPPLKGRGGPGQAAAPGGG